MRVRTGFAHLGSVYRGCDMFTGQSLLRSYQSPTNAPRGSKEEFGTYPTGILFAHQVTERRKRSKPSSEGSADFYEEQSFATLGGVRFSQPGR